MTTLPMSSHLFMLAFSAAFMVVTLAGLGFALARVARVLPR